MRKLITILGPTATGKTQLAAKVATLLDGEVISADSRQVYRGMDLGTGKDLKDYVSDGQKVPYHLIDIVDPGYEYNVYEFQHDFLKVLNKIIENNKYPILCGGTGLYLDAVISGYEMKSVPVNRGLRTALEDLDQDDLIERLRSYGPIHNTTDTEDRERTIRAIEIREYQKNITSGSVGFPDIQSHNFGVYFERNIIRNRITDRLNERLNQGLIAEVEMLIESGLKPEQLIFYGLEYKFVTQFVTGEIDFEKMFELLNTAIHQFAKRQMTWFRRMEKKGVKITWIDGTIPLEQKARFIEEMIEKES
jgi:tRNA dimethylallyltransferase